MLAHFMIIQKAIVFSERKLWLDRPFIYAIINNETGLPVFAGITAKI